MEENKEEIEELEPVDEQPQEVTETPVEETPTVEEVNTVEEKITEAPVEEKKEEKQKKKGKGLLVVIVLLLVIILGGAGAAFFWLTNHPETNKVKQDAKDVKSVYRMSGNGLEYFDLQFLKLENETKNKVYSPLSIKYALEMLGEGSNGASRQQIDAIIGDYKSKKYANSEHMSFANAMFIRNTYKENIKSTYTDNLSNKYNAEVIYDNFDNADNMNKWVSDKTFNLIDNLFDSEKVKDQNFILTNALAIDMNWNNQIQCATGSQVPCMKYRVYYDHETVKEMNGYSSSVSTIQELDDYYPLSFNNKENIKSVEVRASFNRYDAVKEIGEDKIRKEVGDAYREWLKTNNDDQDVDKVVNNYIQELNSNYKKEATSTDFMLYSDDSVKVFAKDLKEYDGTTLQYVGIMPVKENLDKSALLTSNTSSTPIFCIFSINFKS